ncbi:MAG: hypothetical protein E7001_08615 [Coriobacteriaceae bacterium]|nr:hypothetical protein [Coriobacteriaceae bacterium]
MERFLRYYSESTTLFGGKYMPVTDSISFLNAPLDDIVESFDTWRYPEVVHEMSVIELQGSFEDFLKGLEPLGAHPEYLLVATSNQEWTAVLSNYCFGGAQDRIAHRIGYMLGITSIDVFLSWPPPKMRKKPLDRFGVSVQENIPDGTFPIPHRYVATLENWYPKAGEFDVYRHYRSVETIRSLRQTDASNEPLDRFNPSDLLTYCRNLGIEPFREDFYLDRCYRILDEHLMDPFKQETKYSTYTAVQNFLGLRSLHGETD